MKNFIFILFCGIGLSIKAQLVPPSVDQLMALKPHVVQQYPMHKIDSNFLILEMPFAKAHLVKPGNLNYIKNDRVITVHLVYTKYREVDDFNQPELNRSRFETLKRMYPQLFQNPRIQWEVYEQREATTKEAAAKCFHGFIIYQPKPLGKEYTIKEIHKIEKVIKSIRDTTIYVPEKIEYKIKKRKVETGKYLPRSNRKARMGYRYDKPGIWGREPEKKTIRDTIIKSKTGGYTMTVKTFDSSLITNPYVFATLMNRKWGENIAVVQDVTGSMTPYSMQILLWLKMKPEILKNGRFLFFNDGDNVPDGLKVLGKTGGLYPLISHEFDSVSNTLYKAMFNGQGGDVPENNIEALLEAQMRFPDIDTILMIADNNAQVKDISLLPRVKKPVSIILCGVDQFVQSHYIQIARATGGKLYILDKELGDLKNLREGAKFQFGDKYFEYRKSQFIMTGKVANR